MPEKPGPDDAEMLLRQLDIEMAMQRTRQEAIKQRGALFRNISMALVVILILLLMVALWFAGEMKRNAPAPAERISTESNTR